MAPAQPELKKVGARKMPTGELPQELTYLLQYLDKRLFVQLNGSRKVIGILRGYDVRRDSSYPSIRHPSFVL